LLLRYWALKSEIVIALGGPKLGGQAYGQSKTANTWMANHAERMYGNQHLHAKTVHPGGIVEGSNLSRHVPKEQFDAMLEDKETKRTFKSAGQGR
jgi:NAD(P)-dependent dehydrogenase (short-subunit alcohol dehydrogenase family)